MSRKKSKHHNKTHSMDELFAMGMDPDLWEIFKNQIAIVLVERCPNAEVTIPITEVDATEGAFMTMHLDPSGKAFTLKVTRKKPTNEV